MHHGVAWPVCIADTAPTDHVTFGQKYMPCGLPGRRCSHGTRHGARSAMPLWMREPGWGGVRQIEANMTELSDLYRVDDLTGRSW